MPDTSPGRSLAFEYLQNFLSGAFSTVLRQLNCWKGLGSHRHSDLVNDLVQEVVLDCLENPDLVVSLTRHDRHNRWFRLVQQTHYRLRSQRRAAPDPLHRIVDPGTDATVSLEQLIDLCPAHRNALLRLAASAEYLRNGRFNLEGTSRRLRVRSQDLRRLWTSVAERLGYGDDFLRFWRQRLVEALVGLAADLLRDTGGLRIHDEAARTRPDPTGRLNRLRRIRRRLSVRPLPTDIRKALSRITGSGALQTSATEILELAASIGPHDPVVHLWRFEAFVRDGHLTSAARALRRSRSCGADRVRILLARARLLEARGKETHARDLLERSAHCSADPRLQNSLRSLAG